MLQGGGLFFGWVQAQKSPLEGGLVAVVDEAPEHSTGFQPASGLVALPGGPLALVSLKRTRRVRSLYLG